MAAELSGNLALASALILCCSLPAGAVSVKRLEKEIKGRRSQLEQLKERINTLEAERTKLKQDESSLLKSLKRLDAEIERSRKRQSRLKQQISQTERQLRDVAKGIRLYSAEGEELGRSLGEALRRHYIDSVAAARLSRSGPESLARRSLVALNFAEMTGVNAQKDSALRRENELARFRSRLLTLRSDLDEEGARQKKAKEEKEGILATTQGRRVEAERQAQQLRETAASLEDLITQLTEKKEKTLAAQREAEELKKAVQGRRGSYRWPVAGAVVSRFGRQKHAELQHTVINNGVRIRTSPNSAVKAVERGRVIYAADFRSYGPTVIVDHGGEAYSIYGLLGTILVREGKRVQEGEVLGNASSEDDAQIYFEFRNQGRPEDPLLWLRPSP